MYKTASRNAQRRAARTRHKRPYPPLKKRRAIVVEKPNALKELEAGYEPPRNAEKHRIRAARRMKNVVVVKRKRRKAKPRTAAPDGGDAIDTC
ncbi:hypothetical protein [Salinarimonas sp.]|uniref:hypothetical protein n=1 Tax=Salinarimonas sp. TaxID=2766526 RepID=UPI003919FAFB